MSDKPLASDMTESETSASERSTLSHATKASELPDSQDAAQKTNTRKLLLVPVKNTVLFPHNMMPLVAGKDINAEVLDRAIHKNERIGVVAINPNTNDSEMQHIHSVGTEGRIAKVIRFPDGTTGVLVQGTRRFRVVDEADTSRPFKKDELEPTQQAIKYPEFPSSKKVKDNQSTPSDIKPLKKRDWFAEVEFLPDAVPPSNLEMQALARGLKQLIQRAIALSPNIPPEASLFIDGVQDSLYLADIVVPYLNLEFDSKQSLLENLDAHSRLKKIHFYLSKEIEVLEVSQKIQTDVRSEVGNQQRKFYLREQMKSMQKELGELEGRAEGEGSDVDALGQKLAKANLPKEVREVADKEFNRFKMIPAGAPEHTMSLTYLNWILDVPWGIHTQEKVNLNTARKLLDGDHFGLEKVKKRLLEFLAVYSLKKSLKGPILLLVGPPGVGKTSLGKSVAKAMGRKFVRIALGGVRDEAEIRGHRRTYIGSMPGKIVDALKRAGSMDPVILLDELDKLSGDFRGDPTSAMLEVLDPEQNNTFTDHYLNVPVDLSQVLFLGTANSLGNIPGPLRDRLEIVELGGYTLLEKEKIAASHLVPTVVTDHGIEEYANISFEKDSLKFLIQNYTREAGVRQLKRELAAVARRVATEIAVTLVDEKPTKKVSKEAAKEVVRKSNKKILRKISRKDIEEFLGAPKFTDNPLLKKLTPGVSTGLAYTSFGGDLLYLEAALVGTGGNEAGKLSVTGQLGDVMKESVQTALAYIKSHSASYGIAPERLKKDIHLHFPAGAIKKDGPSAGAAIFTALVSLMTNKPVSASIAMTGEISLRGDVLPVGGIKEKCLAAHRFGIKTVLLPEQNKRDLEEIPAEVRKDVKIIFVKTMQDVSDIVFGKNISKTSVKKA